MKKIIFTLCNLLLFSLVSLSQNTGPAIGQWKSFLSYYSGTSCDYSDQYVFVGTQTGFFTYDLNDGFIKSYSKVNGMSSVGVVAVHYIEAADKTVIAYQNGNIDIFSDGAFSNIPDFMITTLPGDKEIYNISSHGKYAYLSTSMGLVILDIEKLEIKGTTQFYEGSVKGKVLDSAILGEEIYACTDVGLFYTDINQAFFQDYSSWNKVASNNFNQIKNCGGDLYVLVNSGSNDSVFKMSSTHDLTLKFHSDVHIGRIDEAQNKELFIATNYSASGIGILRKLKEDGSVVKVSECVFPKKIIQPNSTQIFFADDAESSAWGGLRLVASETSTHGVNPFGPESKYVYDIHARQGEIWIAHGGYTNSNWRFQDKKSYFSSYVNNSWKNYAPVINSNGLSYLSDASRILKNFSTGDIYVGYAHGGLTKMSKDESIQLYRTGVLDGAFGDTSMYIVSGLALDNKGQLWFNNYAGNNELKVIATDGNVYGFHVPSNTNRYAVDVVIDDYGSKWYYSTFEGGLHVFNENNTPSNPSDDKYNSFKTGRDFGNLPSNTVQCLVKDRNGTIWVGTNNGIGIFNSPKDALEGTGNDTAEMRIVKYEGDFDYKRLFVGQSITAIAVDGDNRKWIGTSNNGVFLISADAQEMIHHFTSSNSPLLDDYIMRIAVDDVTGDVYFATIHGLIAYRGAATEPKLQPSEELVSYPNPVPSGYEGYIAIKDLPKRCEVRITDINGYLIAQFETEGGQAVWNGKDYNGRRPQSGVYMVFVTDRMTGKVIKSGKLIFEH